MKKIVLLLTTALLVNFSVHAQSKSSVIKINILSPVVRTLSAFYEKPLSETSSFQLGLQYTGARLVGIRYSGFAITPEYRFYLSKTTDAPNGFYVAPFLRYQNLTVRDVDLTTSGTDAKLNTFGGGVLVGRQWLFGRSENVALDLFIGPSYNAGSVNGDDIDVSSGFNGFGLRFGLALGLALE